ncbi:MAG TPA: flavodoxin family protein [Longimicrobiales bacterium]
MNAIILLATLKKDGLSNTETLAGFLADRMRARGLETTTVKLAERTIPPGTYSDMGDGDEWPAILEQILAADIVVFASPIWWNNHSSLMQRVIERLDELHDHVMEGKPSGLEGKAAGIVVTGDSDGAQTIIANLANFTNGIGLVVPPYSTLTVLWDKLAKGKDTSREEQLRYYEENYAQTADRMIEQLVEFAGG